MMNTQNPDGADRGADGCKPGSASGGCRSGICTSCPGTYVIGSFMLALAGTMVFDVSDEQKRVVMLAEVGVGVGAWILVSVLHRIRF